MVARTRSSRGGSTRRRASSAPADGLDRDYSDEEYREPGEGYNGPQPRKGLYPAKLVSVGHHTKQGDEEPTSVKWGFELTGGEAPNDEGDRVSVAGFRDNQYTNDTTTKWREQQIAVALGLMKPNGRLKMSFDAMVKKAKPCTVRIIRERYIPEDDPDNAEWRAKIVAVLAAREDTGPKSRSRKPKDEDPLDADEEDEPDGDDENDEEEDGWPEDPDELAAELEELSLAELKKVAKEDFEVKITRGMKSDEIIEAVLETLEDEDEDDEEDEPEEDEPEDEPEPPKKRSSRSTSRSSGATAAKGRTSRRAARGSSEEPPF